MNQGDIIYQKYISGDIITDEEIKEGIILFKNAADSCIKCGMVFSIAFKEANHVYMWLESVKQARKDK